MNNLDITKLLENSSKLGVTKEVTNPNIGTSIYVTVTSSAGASFVLRAEGATSPTGEFQAINYIKMNDFSLGSTITANGIYAFPATPLAKFRLNVISVTGTVTAEAKRVEE